MAAAATGSVTNEQGMIPNGEWRGWYEQCGNRSPSNNNMVFSEGRITGRGEDEVGDFVIEGTCGEIGQRSNGLRLEIHMQWKKTYIGQHSVVYQSTECVRLPSGQVQFKGTWRLDPPMHWEGSSGACEFTSVNTSQILSEAARDVAASTEPEEVSQLTTAIAEKLREVAQMRQRLRCLRNVNPAGADAGGSVGFELTNKGDDESSCVICVEATRNSVILWCGHQALCIQCARLLYGRNAPCPICRETIHQVQQTFTP